MGDTKKLAHTKWNCKYHKFLHHNIADGFSMERRKEP